MIVAVVTLYLVASLAVGTLAGRKVSSSTTGFVAGDRSLGLVVMYFITGATIFSAFAFLGAPGWVYSRGVAALYIIAYGTLGFLPFYFLGPRAARLGRIHGFVTQAEMVAARYSMPSLAGVLAVASVIAFVPYLALQMKGAGYVLAVVTHQRLPEWAGAALVYGVVLAYVLHSGVLGVGWTNTLQGVFMMALAWGLGLYLPHTLYGGIGPMFDRVLAARPDLLAAPGLTGAGQPWPWGEYSSAIIVSAAGFCVWPHLFMKAFTARDGQTIRRTVLMYPTFQLFLVPLLFIGFAGVLFPTTPARPDQILPHMLLSMSDAGQIPPLLVGLFCAGALAASMSSGDAMAHAAASIIVRDLVVTALGRRLDASRQRGAIRLAVVAVMLVAYGVAMTYQGSLVMLLLSAFGAVVQLAPVMVTTLYVRRVPGRAVLVALCLASALTVLFTLQPGWRPWPVHAGLYGLALNVSLLLGWGLLRPSAEGVEFLREASRSGVSSSST